MPYNQTSPHGIRAPVDLSSLPLWFGNELQFLPTSQERDALRHIAVELDAFVRWPKEARLYFPGYDRLPETGKKQKYFNKYSEEICREARALDFQPDRRPNGPAIAAFLLAGGIRPKRFGSSNQWSIHHLYSGKFPYLGSKDTTHAAKRGEHFTQSAGLVAIHPIADAAADEYPCFSWLLRAHAFLRFRYDPDGVFSLEQDDLGFPIQELL